MRQVGCAEGELGAGELRSVRVGGVSIVVLRRRDGGLRALRGVCPHQQGDLSRGILEPLLSGTEVGNYRRDGARECLVCPLHGFEFDVDTGRGIADPDHDRVRTYPVEVEDGMIVVERPGGSRG